MKRFGLVLPAFLTLALLGAPIAGAQQYQYQKTNRVEVRLLPAASQPNKVTTYVEPLDLRSQTCPQSEPASTLRTPQALVREMMLANNIPAEMVGSVRVVESSDLNAATDGRNIIITSALLNRLDTNGERAFVLGHELSHIVLDHMQKTTFRRVGLGVLDRFLLRRYVNSGTLADLAAQFGLGAIDKKFSRNYEYQADDVGMQMMVNAGYPACSAISVFETLKAASGPNRLPEFLQDHPLSESRIRALVNKYQTQTGRR